MTTDASRSQHEIETTNMSSLSPQANNRLEVLTVLSQTVLRELDALKRDENPINAMKVKIVDLAREMECYEVGLIRCVLLTAGGRQRQAARMLNLKATTLHAKIRLFGINPRGFSNW